MSGLSRHGGKRALVTRPRHDAQEVSTLLGERGFEICLEPMLEIRPIQGIRLDLTGVQGLVGTSMNGVRALARATENRDLPLFAVGDATARLARELGFQCVHVAEGEVNSLGRLIKAQTDPQQGPLLHAAGSVSAGDLAGDLAQTGHQLIRQILYEACPVQTLSNRLKGELSAGTLDVALFFSPRTATSFTTLVRESGLSTTTGTIRAFALSANVAHALNVLPWAEVHVARSPSLDSLMACLDGAGK